jgi:hypothetical protein
MAQKIKEILLVRNECLTNKTEANSSNMQLWWVSTAPEGDHNNNNPLSINTKECQKELKMYSMGNNL